MDILTKNYNLPHTAFKVLSYIVFTYKNGAYSERNTEHILEILGMSRGTYFKALDILESKEIIKRTVYYGGVEKIIELQQAV